MKKNKTQENIYKWGSFVFTDPYMVIKEVFGFEDIGHYRNFIKDILLYSASKKKYEQENAGSIIWLIDSANGLLDACSSINKIKEHGLIDIWNKDILNNKFYSIREDENDIWSDFPRILSVDEFKNPYLALKNIFKHCKPQKLQREFKELIEYACGSYSDMPELNTFLVYFQLTKLFEAAHLIYIREIVHVMNWR